MNDDQLTLPAIDQTDTNIYITTLLTGETLPMTKLFQRSIKAHNKPKTGTVLPEEAFKGATIHLLDPDAKKPSTLCGKVIDAKDARWRTFSGPDTKCNCKRCKTGVKVAEKTAAKAAARAERQAAKEKKAKQAASKKKATAKPKASKPRAARKPKAIPGRDAVILLETKTTETTIGGNE